MSVTATGICIHFLFASIFFFNPFLFEFKSTIRLFSSERPVRCSICSSAPNREGLDCIETPQKFVQECNTIPGEEEFNGCWKIEQFVLYDGPEPTFNRIEIYNNTIAHNDNDAVQGDSGLKVDTSDDKNTDECEQQTFLSLLSIP